MSSYRAVRLLHAALIAALGLVLPEASLADGFGEEDGFEAGEDGENLGSLALLALMVNVAYVPYKWLRKSVPELKIPHALSIHCWAGTAALVLGAVHALAAGDGNLLLWVGLLLMGYLTAAGLVMRSDLASGRTRRTAYLLHAQRAVFYLMLAALSLGHAFAGD